MSPKTKNSILKLFEWKNGLVVDLAAMTFFLVLNFGYLIPFLKEADQINTFSAPLVLWLAWLVGWLGRLEEARAVTFSLAFFLALGPSLFYLFAKALTGRRLAGFAAALFYSLPLDWLARGRAQLAFLIGDGGHVAALSLVPVAVLLLFKFLKEGKFKNLVYASLMMGLVALCSPFGMLTGLMILTVAAFSEFLQGDGRLKILRFGFFVAFTVGFVAFWYNPGFVSSFLGSSQGEVIVKTFSNLIPLTFVVVPVAGAFGFLLFERRAHLQPLFVALGLMLLFSLVSFASRVGRLFPSHPRRYVPEMGMALSFLVGVLAMTFSDYLRFKGKFYKVKLTPLGRSMARRAFWLTSMGVMGAVIIFSFGSVGELSLAQVLGVESGLMDSDIWEIRARTGGLAEGVGYGITFLTTWLAIFLGLRFREKEELE